MTQSELKALAEAVGLTPAQFDGMTASPAAAFLTAAAAVKQADLAALSAPLEAYLLQLQIEATRVHIAVDRAIAKEKGYVLDVPPTPPFAA